LDAVVITTIVIDLLHSPPSGEDGATCIHLV
jgi:hypothetical protein